MEHTHPARRRARALRHLADAAGQRASRRRGSVVGAYWWVGSANFGDDLTPWLLPRYGIVPVHRRAVEARLAGVGSIVGTLPPSFDGAIWGSGLIEDRQYPLPDAKILALRGHLTRERVAAPPGIPLGDPGLLVSRWIQRPKIRWDVGLVPHADHRRHQAFLDLANTAGLRVRVVDVRNTAARAMRELAACASIVTTSLHGLVTADSFGIPAVWTVLEPALSGGDFKFRDYESVITPGTSRQLSFDPRMPLAEMLTHTAAAPRAAVDSSGDALEAAIRRLPDVLDDLPRFPFGVAQVVASKPRSESRS